MAESASGRSVSPKMVVVGILVLVVVVLAVVNSTEVPIDLVVTTVRLPLFVVIVGSAAIGWVVGWFTGRRKD